MRKLKKPDVGIILFDIMVAVAALMTGLFILTSKLPHENSSSSVMTGSICVEAYWPNDRNIDLDLWVKSPLDKYSVGYTHMHDMGSDLFRDVIGFMNNPSHNNMEMTCTRGLSSGEYIYDIHFYSDHERPATNDTNYSLKEVPANIIVRIRKPDNSVYTLTSDYTFKYEGQDKTMLSFILGKDGIVVSGSQNSTDRHIARPRTLPQ